MQGILFLLGTGTMSGGSAYLGAQTADTAVLRHEVEALGSEMKKLKTAVSNLQSTLDRTAGSRWTREQHDRYAEGVAKRVRQIEQDMADLH